MISWTHLDEIFKNSTIVYCAPCRFFGPYVNCIRFQIKLNPLHIWQHNISKSTIHINLYYIALLSNILFLKIYVQKLTCCSWKLGFRGIIFSARKLQECRILHDLPPAVRQPLRGGGDLSTLHFGVATPMSNNESEQRNFTHLIRCQTMKVKPYIILNTSRKHVNYEEDKNKVPMNKPYNI